MKIGPIDISYKMIIYTGAIVAEVIALLTLWNANSEIRAESIYRQSVQRGLYDAQQEGVAASIDAVQKVIGYSPKRVDARLYLGALQYRQKEFKAAQKSFEEAAAMPNATAQHKAWALCGAAASSFSAATKEDGAKAGSEAERLFKQASEIKFDNGKRSADALAGLAILAYLRGADKDALTLSNQALEAGDPPALKVLAQVYNIRGLIQAKQGLAREATASFTQAQFLRPDRTDFGESRRLSYLAAVTEKSLTDQQRQDMLAKIERDLSTYGKHQSLALMVIGQAHGSFKSQKDYMKRGYVDAMQAFARAINRDPAELRCYRAKSNLIEDRINDLVQTLTSPISGLKGETPVISAWGGPKTRFAPLDVGAINEIRTLLNEMESLWGIVAERSSGGDKVEARLRQVAAVRRLYWTSQENDIATHKALFDKMVKLCNEIITLDPKSGQGHFTLALVHVDRGDFGAAMTSAKAAKANGLALPEVDRLIEGLALKPEIFDIRPTDKRRWFGTVPLLSGSLRSTSTAYKDVKMQVDGKDIQPIVAGTQVMFVPEENFSMDGSHTVKITITDKFDSVVEFPEFSFGVDKKAPTIKVLPDSGAIEKKPVFNITLGDASGVDASATLVVFKTVKGPQMITRELVKDGKYKIGFPDLKPPVRANTLAGESFVVTPGQELQPGEYSLVITSTDLNGNTATETKTYTVK
ncbi:MAG TPA: hypothetical protein VEK08_23820 [Planctomycetota bacterium]|nr:hypothetical protein [Planctomycetota bacterium]